MNRRARVYLIFDLLALGLLGGALGGVGALFDELE